MPEEASHRTETTPQTTAHAERDPAADFPDLFMRAVWGDEQSMQELHSLLEEIPHWEREFIGPAGVARRLLMKAAVGTNLPLRAAWERQAKAMERELAGPQSSPLERILCERIASCWLDAHVADAACANWFDRDGVNFAAGTYYLRRQERAHSRYIGAVLALARVRRLLAPVVAQVNIAQAGAQQLNIAAPATPDTPVVIPAGDDVNGAIEMALGHFA